ncbi:MAG: hypothetical protein ABSF41_14900 [Pseudolabrys sp.]|jgi:hypothetical protein
MHRRLSISLCVGAALAAGMLAGCAVSDDSLSSVLVAPGHYVLFQCDDIARTGKETVARMKELEQLMARAGTSAGGQLIGGATYGPEYETRRGALKDLRAAAIEKNCNFVPGAETPAAPASNPQPH